MDHIASPKTQITSNFSDVQVMERKANMLAQRGKHGEATAKAPLEVDPLVDSAYPAW